MKWMLYVLQLLFKCTLFLTLQGSKGAWTEIIHSFKADVLAVAVGKVTAEALREEGIERILAPENERMGAMIIELSNYLSVENKL